MGAQAQLDRASRRSRVRGSKRQGSSRSHGPVASQGPQCTASLAESTSSGETMHVAACGGRLFRGEDALRRRRWTTPLVARCTASEAMGTSSRRDVARRPTRGAARPASVTRRRTRPLPHPARCRITLDETSATSGGISCQFGGMPWHVWQADHRLRRANHRVRRDGERRRLPHPINCPKTLRRWRRRHQRCRIIAPPRLRGTYSPPVQPRSQR